MVPALTPRSWPDVETGGLLLVPVGSIEQHGPHLPLDTDSVIAGEVASRVAVHLADEVPVLVAPPIVYGASGEHHGFPGTLSIGTEVLTTLLVELVRSAQLWADRMVFVNAHGGNVFALTAAVTRLRAEGHDAAWVACATEEVDLHAGLTETSIMLHLRPADVDVRRAEAGCTDALSEILPTLMSGGVRAVSPNGVLGDPTGATAEHGRVLVAGIVRDVLHAVRHGLPDERGLLHPAAVHPERSGAVGGAGG
ncbi:mycofactocin biosynthesis peptidyl-dipeptidase MftE [Nocardioides alkalitolerans]|uniref:mycofactocin biosynthesis peptidyl-dipeptidase MftE n=1 Tax=Nocardioides alkalitolerans TaxID=281714 RepID=UPI000410674A|nr:mycofactocin biosynthesis peptidyl-dipeptidase MftE [Nocardioides alkalitolerans]